MITGYFRPTGPQNSSPYVDGSISIPSIGIIRMEVRFLIDTGADRTLLGDTDADRMLRDHVLDLEGLDEGLPSQGIGGVVATREVQATLGLDDFSISISLDILEPTPGQPPSVPSLLGRDVLSHFALLMEDRTNRVLLLEPHEADRLGLG